MSYLDSPRIHFRGWFQADVSTINNDVRFFQNDSFVPEYQQLDTNGSWNPRGTAVFRILDCSVTGGFLIAADPTDPLVELLFESELMVSQAVGPLKALQATGMSKPIAS